MDLPESLINEVQKYTNAPWWNGHAYAEFKGYPGRINEMEIGIGDAIDDLFDVMEWLRSEKLFAQSDRIRTISGRLARLRGPSPDKNSTSVRDIACSWV